MDKAICKVAFMGFKTPAPSEHENKVPLQLVIWIPPPPLSNFRGSELLWI